MKLSRCASLLDALHSSIELLQISLRDQTLDIPLPDVELAILCQVNSARFARSGLAYINEEERGARCGGLPILGLDLPCILQHAHVNEKIFGRL